MEQFSIKDIKTEVSDEHVQTKLSPSELEKENKKLKQELNELKKMIQNKNIQLKKQDETMEGSTLNESSSQESRRRTSVFSFRGTNARKLEDFDGNSDVTLWISRFKNATAFDDISEEDQLFMIGDLFKGRAATWYTLFGSKLNSIADVLESLKNYFSDTNNRVYLLKLHDLKQNYQQTVEDFAWEVLNLCSKINSNMNELDMINHFILGLKSSWKKKLIIENFKSFDDV